MSRKRLVTIQIILVVASATAQPTNTPDFFDIKPVTYEICPKSLQFDDDSKVDSRVTEINKAIELDPTNSYAYNNRGYLKMKMHKSH